MQHNPFEHLPDVGVTRPRKVAVMLDVTPQTVYNMVKSGRLPPPVRIGANSTGFVNRALKELGARMVKESAQ